MFNFGTSKLGMGGQVPGFPGSAPAFGVGWVCPRKFRMSKGS